MTTLAYGQQADEIFARGNRPDAEVDPGASGEHPRLKPTIELRARPATDEPFEESGFEPFGSVELFEPFERVASFRGDVGDLGDDLDEDTQPSTPYVARALPLAPLAAAAPTGAPMALPVMMVGLVLVSILLAGLAICGIALGWRDSLSGGGVLALTAVGGYLLAVGVAALVAGPFARRA